MSLCTLVSSMACPRGQALLRGTSLHASAARAATPAGMQCRLRVPISATGRIQRRRTQRKRTAKMAQRVDTGFDAMELRTMDSVDSIDTLNPELTQRLRALARDSLDSPDFTLFYTQETAPLARKVAGATNHVNLGTVRWNCFDDGFPNLFVENAEQLRNKHVAFLASFHSPQVMFEQLAVIYALPRMFVASFTLILPFFPTGTSERVEDEGEVATAASLARMLSGIPLSRGGPTSMVVFDIHALQERFYFGDNVLPYFQTAIPLLKAQLAELPDHANITIAYPDEGAWKRFHRQFEAYDQLVCTKVRDGKARKVSIKEGDATGRHVVIVDDLVQSGGTLIECQKVLAAAGAKHVSAFVTHGIFPKLSYERFFPELPEGGAASGFKHFWVTDSCPQTSVAVENREPFIVLSLADTIASCLHL